MKSLVLLFGLVALSGLVTGCGDDPSPEEIASAATQALGIPVMLWAQADDTCVSRQMTAFYKEFSKAPKDKQQQLMQKYKGFSAVVIQVSRDEGALKADRYEVRLMQKTCSRYIEPNYSHGPGMGGFDSAPTTTRVYCDTELKSTARTARPAVTSTGERLGTRVDKVAQADGQGPILYITPTMARDSSVAKVVSIGDAKYFDALKGNPDAIESALLGKSIKLLSAKAADPVACGRPMSLFDSL
jgi:hypothetical protein